MYLAPNKGKTTTGIATRHEFVFCSSKSESRYFAAGTVAQQCDLEPRVLCMSTTTYRQEEAIKEGKEAFLWLGFFLFILEDMLSRDFFLYPIGQCAWWTPLDAWKEFCSVFFKLDCCRLWCEQNHPCLDKEEVGMGSAHTVLYKQAVSAPLHCNLND